MRDDVEVLSGGELLVSGSAVLWFASIAERAVHVQRHNGIRNPLAERWLASARNASALTRTADIGRSAVPIEADSSLSGLIDPVSASEAAMIMNCKVRNVTDLCRRGAFATACQVQGRWQIERGEVVARAERMAS